MFINTITGEYPITEQAIRLAHPLALFGTPFTPPPEYGVVFLQPYPEYDAQMQYLREGAPTLREDGKWYQTWTVENYSTEELQDQQTRFIANLRSEIINRTQQRLNDFAATRIYDSVDSISKYQNITDEEIASLPESLRSHVARFRVETRYLGLITAATWANLYVMFDEVQAGTRALPSCYEDIESELPALQWPA